MFIQEAIHKKQTLGRVFTYGCTTNSSTVALRGNMVHKNYLRYPTYSLTLICTTSELSYIRDLTTKLKNIIINLSSIVERVNLVGRIVELKVISICRSIYKVKISIMYDNQYDTED